MTQVVAELQNEQACFDTNPIGLTAIYEPEVNLAAWRAGLAETLRQESQRLCQQQPGFKLVTSGTSAELAVAVENKLDGEYQALVERLQLCLDMFTELFESQSIGLRLEVLDRAMCPRFHVDRLTVRLISTFYGPATEWLPNVSVNRRWLGPAAAGKTDETSGLIIDASAIQTLEAGDVVLMKGEAWDGNEGYGLVHRSPEVSPADRRLALTLDWLS